MTKTVPVQQQIQVCRTLKIWELQGLRENMGKRQRIVHVLDLFCNILQFCMSVFLKLYSIILTSQTKHSQTIKKTSICSQTSPPSAYFSVRILAKHLSTSVFEDGVHWGRFARSGCSTIAIIVKAHLFVPTCSHGTTCHPWPMTFQAQGSRKVEEKGAMSVCLLAPR